MRRLLAAVLLAALLVPSAARGQGASSTPCPRGANYPASPLGYQQITSLSSAATLTVPAKADYAIAVPETQAIRYRDDGTAPTTSVGMLVATGQAFTICGAQLRVIQIIQAAASATLNVSYYGGP